VLAAVTVHLWNNLSVFFAFMLGSGAWFQNIRGTDTTNELPADLERF
jgi:hypothetical protein